MTFVRRSRFARRLASIAHAVPRLAALLSGAVLTLALAGCGSTPTPTYNLSAPSGFTAGGSGNGQMVVVAPTALAVLNTDKVMVEPGPGQVAYLSDAQWSDTLPALLQARTIQAFENASKLRRVARPGDGVNADYQLVIDIRTFALRITDQGPVAVVELSAKLIGTQSGRILAAQVFKAAVPAASTAGPVATAALDSAQEQVLVQMVRWASAKF
ncbi:ABC-type transport auxiliary lipoprotein family protein [Xanthobacter versatilis]|uniref:ABC-type transport auxiliary lipoprotein component domain-containing protein n=1 Tax=Xanthobacter autotrophicus (strain ATCC BAA-1158 / Py2) TaxID=78245 RepID=A7IMU5_XANP2|nr:protein of unknown function DUF330 [Xanthobacter autotrophicus Py2]